MVLGMNSSKQKGDRNEREAVEVLKAVAPDLVLPTARRKLGAGRQDDMGDLDAFDDTTVQVKALKSVSEAIRAASQGARVQAARAATRFHVGLAPIPGARRTGVKWLCGTYEWPTDLPDDTPTFSITVTAIDWLRRPDNDRPLENRVVRLSRAGVESYLGTVEAWTAALREARRADFTDERGRERVVA